MSGQSKCNLCGSTSTKILQKFGESLIVSCNNCGFVYTDKGKRKNLLSVYNEDYFHIENTEKRKVGYRSYESDEDHHTFYFKKKVGLIKRFIKEGKILDVGCALGFFMKAASEEGFSPFGVDVSSYAISYTMKRFPRRAILSSLTGARLKENSFDCITLFQTIEHLERPLDNLRKANKILIKNGIIVIATPNHNCILRKILGKYWFEYKPEEHLCFFNEKTIKFLLEKCGFRLVYSGKDVFYYPISYILERFSYYSSIKVFNKSFYLIYKIFDKLFTKNIRVPLPLGGIIVVAQKI